MRGAISHKKRPYNCLIYLTNSFGALVHFPAIFKDLVLVSSTANFSDIGLNSLIYGSRVSYYGQSTPKLVSLFSF